MGPLLVGHDTLVNKAENTELLDKYFCFTFHRGKPNDVFVSQADGNLFHINSN